MTNEEIEKLINKAARRAVNEYARRQEKKTRDKSYHNTFLLMKSYRDAAFHAECAVSEAEQVKKAAAGSTKAQEYLRSIRKTRFQTMIMLAHIDTALKEIEKRRDDAGRGIEYTAFDLYFMQGLTYEQIAEALNTGVNTPRRWISAIINELSVLLWGIDEDKYT